MSVERNKDGSVTIKTNNGVTVIGKITRDDKHKERFERWVEDCAKSVNACAHTPKETEEYFLQNCDALPIASDDSRMKNFQCNVIMNFFQDRLKHRPTKFSFDMTDDEIEKWQKDQNAIHEEALKSPPERFGLVMRGYYLPRTRHNEIFYEQVRLSEQGLAEHSRHKLEQAAQAIQQDIRFFFEETTGYCQSTGGGDNLLQQLIIYRGVNENDIEKRSPRFLGYISAMRDLGYLPDFIKSDNQL